MVIDQFFVELTVEEDETLSQALAESVNDLRERLNATAIEVQQVIPHDAINYTVIMRVHNRKQV